MGASGTVGEGDFDAIAYLEHPRWRDSSYGLSRTRALLERLGRPDRRFKSIHVAGTNGKGSTCAFVSSVLRHAGFKVGLFTSPGIASFNERIQIDGNSIPDDHLLEVTLQVKLAAEEVEAELGEHPTEFELSFAVCMAYFAIQECDWAVIECGLGGRLDATNVIVPEVSAICRIGMDHTDMLGSSLEEIASEKCGIIKAGVPVASWPQVDSVMDVIRSRCEELGCSLVVPDLGSVRVCPLGADLAYREFAYKGKPYQTKLLGSYQPYNAALAMEISWLALQGQLDAEGLAVATRNGIRDAAWPFRFDVVGTAPVRIVDGAHNVQGASALAESLEDAGIRKAVLAFGALADKDHRGMLEAVAPYCECLFAFSPDNPRAESACALADEANDLGMEAYATDSAEEAVSLALERSNRTIPVIAFGSLYSAHRLKRALMDGECA